MRAKESSGESTKKSERARREREKERERVCVCERERERERERRSAPAHVWLLELLDTPSSRSETYHF